MSTYDRDDRNLAAAKGVVIGTVLGAIVWSVIAIAYWVLR